MLDGLGFPPGGPQPADPEGNMIVSTARQWRQYDSDRADADLLRRTATWLGEHPDRAGYAGLSSDTTARALAALLELLATSIADLDPAVRRQAVEACRVMLGQTTANPARRRTRRT
jgi:hypothetical protein